MPGANWAVSVFVRSRTTPTGQAMVLQAVAITVVGIILGALALTIPVLPPRLAPLVFAAALCPFAAMIVGNVRRSLLVIVVLDTALQLDVNLDYHVDAASLGALGGLNLSVTTACLAILYLLWLGEVMARIRSRRHLLLRPGRPLILYLVIAALSTLVARDPTLSLYEIFLFLQMFLLYIYVVSTVQTREDVIFVVTLLMIDLCLESMLIIGLGYGGVHLNLGGLASRVDAAKHAGGVSRFAGTLGSANTAGAYLSIMLTLAMSVLLTRLGRVRKQLAILAFGLGAIALILTFSRGGWTAFALGITILCLVAWWRGWISLTLPVAIVIVALLAAAFFQDAVVGRVVSDDNGSAYSRIPLMRIAFAMIGDNPVLGVGANNFAVVVPQYVTPEFSRDFIYSVHNQYLLIWSETGFGGLVAFLWFLFATLRKGWQCWRLGDRLLSPIAMGLTAGIMGCMAHMFVDLFRGRQLVQLLWLVAALVTVMHNILLQGNSAIGRGLERSEPLGSPHVRHSQGAERPQLP